MKKYKISELAALYGICSDTLRYYEEQGLLKPVRGENNYRQYTLRDIFTLNIIRDLRELDMPLWQIKQYAERRTRQSTVQMLIEQEKLIDARINALKRSKKQVSKRKLGLQSVESSEISQPQIKHIARRACFSLSAQSISDKDIDFQLRSLENQHDGKLKMIGNLTMGARLEQSNIDIGIFNRYDNVFFLAPQGEGGDSEIGEGDFACMTYSGAYDGLERTYNALLDFCSEQGVAPCAAPIELYLVEAHDTDLEHEFLTEVQIEVKHKRKV